MSDGPGPKESFVAGRVRSIGCALSGIAHLLRTQRNAHIHAVATAGVVGAGITLRLAPADWCWLTVAIALVWTAESMNTALELLCDATHPAHHPLIGKAKDLAAGSVLLAAIAAIAIGAFVLIPRLPI